MLLTSLYTPHPDQPGALVASLWQGTTPPDLRIQRWLYLGEPREKMLLVWEVDHDSTRAWLEARMAPYGELVTWVTSDSTEGMVAAMERDYDRFGAFLRARGSSEERIERELDVRRRGAAAPSVEAAASAAAAWAAEGG